MNSTFSCRIDRQGRALICWTAIALLVFTGCRSLDPNYAYRTGENSTTRLILNSEQVQQLLLKAATRDLVAGQVRWERTEQERIQLEFDVEKHPDKYAAEREAVSETLAQQPGVTVIGKQYFRLLRDSVAPCDLSGRISSDTYILVRVTTGPAKGVEGWACSEEVQAIGDGVL